MRITLIETDRDTQNQNTTQWFLVEGVSFGLCHNQDRSCQLLDSEGYPIDDCNDHEKLKAMLMAYN